MEDVKKNIAALFNSRPAKRYAPRKKRPGFKGYVSLNLLDRPLDSQDNLPEYIPLDILDIPIILKKDKKKNDIQPGILSTPNPVHLPDAKKSNDYIRLDTPDKVIPQKKMDKAKDEHYISLDILDQPKKQKCEHLSPVMDCFAGGFGHIRCFDQDFHETCQFKLSHKKMLADREQIRSNLEKFG